MAEIKMADPQESGTVKLVSKPRSGPPAHVLGRGEKEIAALAMDRADLKAAIELESAAWKKNVDISKEPSSEAAADEALSRASDLVATQGAKLCRKVKLKHAQTAERMIKQYNSELMSCLDDLTTLLVRISEIKVNSEQSASQLQPLLVEARELINLTFKFVIKLPEQLYPEDLFPEGLPPSTDGPDASN